MMLDILTTIYALDVGIAYEANNGMVSVVNNIPLFFLVKVIGTIAIFALLGWVDSKNVQFGNISRYILGAMLFSVVANNSIVIIIGIR